VNDGLAKLTLHSRTRSTSTGSGWVLTLTVTARGQIWHALNINTLHDMFLAFYKIKNMKNTAKCFLKSVFWKNFSSHYGQKKVFIFYRQWKWSQWWQQLQTGREDEHSEPPELWKSPWGKLLIFSIYNLIKLVYISGSFSQFKKPMFYGVL
jgi:hypothetical protein